MTSGDPRKGPVKEAMSKCQHTMSQVWGAPLSEHEFGDDRLGRLLNRLGQPEVPEAGDCAVTHQSLRYYPLDTEGAIARRESTSVSVSGAGDGTKSRVWQQGHSQEQRPDLQQCKVRRAALDPMGMPVVTPRMRGTAADDGW